jgi:Predicted acyl-CoA transferases/carnitine dehydratase
MLLGDLGADVIKAEKAGVGDDSRYLPPYINGQSVYNFVMNRNKRGIEIDFRSDEGKELLKKLAKKADVLIENFRPGTMEKMGCGWEQLQLINPRIILASISGFGGVGPYKDKPGFDAAIQAMSGLMSITGEPDGMPMMYGTYCVDYSAAMYTTISILAALMSRSKTGKGQHVEISLLESAASLLLTAIPMQVAKGETLGRVGNRDRYTAPGNCFRTKDGKFIMIIAGNEAHFKRLVKAMDKEYILEDERFKGQDIRFRHAEEIEKYVAEWVSQYTIEELKKILDENSIVSAKVEDIKDLVENPQLKYRDKLVDLKHPLMGKVTMMGFPFDFSDMKLDIRYVAPTLGQHNEEVLKDWLEDEK